MKVSKYYSIDENILIEYIYDDSILIGEPYNILHNSNTGFKCFVSADEKKPTRVTTNKTNNDLLNQLYVFDYTQKTYAKIPKIGLNKINDSVSFLEMKNYGRSIPIQYDTIKVHVPVDYTFEDMKGFHLRIYTFNYNHDNIVELSNFYFDISDIDQNYKLEYSSPSLLINEKQWGKYVKLLIPSANKISDQRRLNVTRKNSINYNLTDGLGLSKNSPVFIDFHFIESIDTIEGIKYFNLSSRLTVSVPQTPDYEKLGVKIEESDQGFFFIIYGTYNGNLGDFENYIEESYYQGKRFYVEYQVDIFEKNSLVKSYNFVVMEDFGEPIEFRPVLKFTTSTAVIDVTMKLIDNVSGFTITRKCSYGLLQGGGQKMGSEFIERLGLGNRSGGAGDISKYARSLNKINLKSANRKEIINIKSNTLANTEKSPFGSKPVLKLKNLPFVLFATEINANSGSDKAYKFNGKTYYPDKNQSIILYPFDNILKIEIIKPNPDEKMSVNLNDFTDIKLTFKNDIRDIEFEIYLESPDNDFTNGKIVFKISEGSYPDIKYVSSANNNLIYINGKDVNDIKTNIYSMYYTLWDSTENILEVLNNYNSYQNTFATASTVVVEKKVDKHEKEIENVKLAREIGTAASALIESGTPLNVASVPQLDIETDENFRPKWKADIEMIIFGLSRKDFNKPAIKAEDIEKKLLSIGYISKDKLKDKLQQILSLQSAEIMEQIPSINRLVLKFFIGYFKGLNIKPDNNTIDELFLNQKFVLDVTKYIESGISGKVTSQGIGVRSEDIERGEFLPSKPKYKEFGEQNVYKQPSVLEARRGNDNESEIDLLKKKIEQKLKVKSKFFQKIFGKK